MFKAEAQHKLMLCKVCVKSFDDARCRCHVCKQAFCSFECQKAHWASTHKKEKRKLVDIRKLKEEDDEESEQPNKRPKQSLSKHQQQLASKLQSGQFRFLNEKLYTSTSDDALHYFEENPAHFEDYHSGFQQQSFSWPTNPLDVVIKIISSLKHFPSIIADFGCGEAQLSLELDSDSTTIHSFDLHALNNRVTVCNMKNTPLDDFSVNCCVFCLSLMGTDWLSFIIEAKRVLKQGGLMIIAEITSRFSNVRDFVTLLRNLGFDLQASEDDKEMFIYFRFIKSSRDTTSDFGKLKKKVHLKECKYKRR